MTTAPLPGDPRGLESIISGERYLPGPYAANPEEYCLRIARSLTGLVFAVCLAANTMPAVAQMGNQKLPALNPPLTAPKIQTPQPQATHFSADTANPGFQGSVNAGGVLWQCAGGKCTASGPATQPTVQACSELARTAGALRSFAYGQSALGPNELGACNAAVASAPKQGIGGIGPLGMMPQGPMGAAPQAPALSPGMPPIPSGTPSSAGPGLKRSITVDDFAPLTPPLPDAPHRVTPPTPSTKPSGTQAITDPAQNPIISAAPLMAMPELRPTAPMPGKTFSLQAPLTPPATKPATTPKPQPDNAQKPPPAATPASAAPGPRSYPVSIRTEGMTVTGTGPADRPFTPKRIPTEGMTVTGTGSLADRPFTLKSISTEGMTVTGTGALP